MPNNYLIGFMSEFTPLVVRVTSFYSAVGFNVHLYFLKNIILFKYLFFPWHYSWKKVGRLSPPVEQVLDICLLYVKILWRMEHIILLHSDMNNIDAYTFLL